MSKTKTGQVNTEAAGIYDEFFIPALFGEWTARVADAAKIEKGQKVLDVACGTGVLACEAFERVGPEGSVTGLDINEGMLSVAGAKSPGIDWKYGAAESIPFEDESFERVVSQFGLMFFTDRIAALKEMFRVLKPGGKLAVAVWASLEDAAGYKSVVGMLRRLFGEEAADALRSPYSLGDARVLEELFEKAGIENAEIEKIDGKARFPSIESWMYTDVRGWTLADLIDDEQFEVLLEEAHRELRPFVSENGTVEFNHPALLVTAVKS